MVDIRTSEQERKDEWAKTGAKPAYYPNTPDNPSHKRYGDTDLNETVHSDSVGKPVDDAVPAPKVTYDVVSNINKELYDAEYKLDYPFNNLEVGQGFFVPNKPAETTIKNLERMHAAVVLANEFYSEAEVDEAGDEVWETVFVKSRQRNVDGTFKLTGDGKYIESADQINRPRLIYFRHYMAYAIIKDYEMADGNKAKEDGVLVVRVN